MADTVREIERKYEATDGRAELPELTGAGGVATIADSGVVALDATYYDTPGQRLAADGITLRHRTGGDDEGWHLKLPVGPDTRDEIRAPLADTLPRGLLALVRSRTRGTGLVPLVRLRTERTLRHLRDADGALLAEVAVDRVTARRLTPERGASADWTEIEVELAEGADPSLLDVVERRLTAAGLRRAASPSKLARALAETDPARKRGGKSAKKQKKQDKAKAKAKGAEKPPPAPTAGDVVLEYVRRQIAAVVTLDPAVRLDAPDSVHSMRVATRRLRSAFRSYGKVLDRVATDPIGQELKWLAAELGVDRDREVLTARLHQALDELPRSLHLGPVRTRVRTWAQARRGGSRRRLIAVLDGRRYLTLLESLDALLAEPPLLPKAAEPPGPVILKAVLKDYDRLACRVATALDTPPGPDRDVAVHEARKAAKRARYAAEAARPALGKPAKRFAKRMRAVQDVLGEHQDSVVVRGALRDLAVQAHAAGESAFTFGLLYGREEARAAARERDLPELWAEVSRKKHRAALRG